MQKIENLNLKPLSTLNKHTVVRFILLIFFLNTLSAKYAGIPFLLAVQLFVQDNLFFSNALFLLKLYI
jgi:hypothetical protein